MKGIIKLLTVLMLISCASNSQDKLVIESSKSDLPLKIFHRDQTFKDSAFINICFPKRIHYRNNSDQKKIVKNFKLNYYRTSTNRRYFPTYKYNDSLTYSDGFEIDPQEKDSIDIYYCYRIKESKSFLDSLLVSKKPVQKKADWNIYDLPISQKVKKWAISKITDSMLKAKLHFSLYNETNNYDFKSLDIKLFED